MAHMTFYDTKEAGFKICPDCEMECMTSGGTVRVTGGYYRVEASIPVQMLCVDGLFHASITLELGGTRLTVILCNGKIFSTKGGV
jgi:hypothetical protein